MHSIRVAICGCQGYLNRLLSSRHDIDYSHGLTLRQPQQYYTGYINVMH